ncbi:hypothetical protein [Chondromyces apiculatus]|uniref:Uncharacterized protein n=1 Tax=Chondromyces apiculatus DSM 436 TaxID=1192034 RepID=A0A017TE07_9BACT|nr:hypothetical protein [Chondromyces apiculatus]EYF07523.1 Hypothetical protein CAP_0276 [Chondromyces apiculatus DSM 436]
MLCNEAMLRSSLAALRPDLCAFHLVFAASALVAGCTASPRPLPPVAATTVVLATPIAAPPLAEEPDARVFLVWGRGADGAVKTYRVNAAGEALGEEEGVTIATPQGEWRWEMEAVALDTGSCDPDIVDKERGQGSATRAEVALRGGEMRALVVAPRGDFDGANEIDHSVSLLASVGPYLFIQERTYMYACGAHGSTAAAFLVWNIERAAPVDLLEELSEVQRLQQEGRAALDEESTDFPMENGETELPELVQITPAYSPEGRLRFDAQLTRAACYACSDGMWSSYSRSAVVPSGWSSARFTAWSSRPTGVARFVAQRQGFELGGWSAR